MDGEVVRLALAAAAFDVEAPVVALVRRALGEDDHAAHGVGALQGGDVEALDAPRRRGQPQRLLDLRQRLGLPVGVGLPLGLQRGQGGRGVLGGQLQQLMLRPLGGNGQHHLFAAAAAAQPLLDDRPLVQVLLQQDAGRHERGLVVELLDERGQQLAVGVRLHAFQYEVFTADQLAAADEEDLHARFAGARILGEGDDVLVLLRCR